MVFVISTELRPLSRLFSSHNYDKWTNITSKKYVNMNILICGTVHKGTNNVIVTIAWLNNVIQRAHYDQMVPVNRLHALYFTIVNYPSCSIFLRSTITCAFVAAEKVSLLDKLFILCFRILHYLFYYCYSIFQYFLLQLFFKITELLTEHVLLMYWLTYSLYIQYKCNLYRGTTV